MRSESTEAIDYKLLIIDDEIEITKTLFRQFRRKYDVFVANSAYDALPIIEKENIAVVLSDQRMPGMTGVDFFSKIKDSHPDVLKLILTGYSDIGSVVDAINDGQVFRYISKPWNPMELESAVNEAFDKYDLVVNNRKLLVELNQAKLELEAKVEERTKNLAAANDKLKHLNVEKNSYIGIVAHDLRNPIGNALALSEILISDYDRFTKEQHLEFLGIVTERCDYSLRLIENVLDVSKIESGILDLTIKEIDYLLVVKKCISSNMLFSERKDQELILISEFEDVKVDADSDKIEQVINNLLSNAIKYSNPGRKIAVELDIVDGQLVTRVVDHGQGIPQNELSGLFNEFQTTSVKSTAEEKSTGLGLAIVKKIIETHNGTIGVTSTVGEGSVFYFTLPM